MEPLTSILLSAALAAGPGVSASQTPAGVIASSDRMTFQEFDERTRMSANFPNELHRLYGSEAAAGGRWGDALRQFRLAARYGDKYSQHRISLMYWHGVGVERDPALAYAWADLAAERMYPTFVVLREKMWLELGEGDRARALSEGAALYDEYGDREAKPRLAAAILRQNKQITGSRVGYNDGRLHVYAPGPGAITGSDSLTGVDLRPMYAPWRMDPQRYWAVEDAIWKDGSVEVGPARKAHARDRDED
ncbi:hypothetical protein ACFW0P_08770 [Lysobacter soli]|uniref:hypothetical protein n=1 Tax=Lysobacter soli TaxID=453783 RepID=UPI0036AD580A